MAPDLLNVITTLPLEHIEPCIRLSRGTDNRAVMTSWSSLTVTCNMFCPINSETGYIWAKRTHYLAAHMWRAVGNENCVIWPGSADRFLSPPSLPSPSFPLCFLPLLGCGEAGTWQKEGGRMDLQPGVRATPQGSRRGTQGLMGRWPAVFCDLWRLGASGHCRLLSSLSSVSLRRHCRIARSHTHCTTVCGSIQRGIPRTCWTAAQAHIQPLLPTLSHTKINTSINISTLQHRVLQSHHMSIRPSLLCEYSPFDCVWITISHGVSGVEPSV